MATKTNKKTTPTKTTKPAGAKTSPVAAEPDAVPRGTHAAKVAADLAALEAAKAAAKAKAEAEKKPAHDDGAAKRASSLDLGGPEDSAKPVASPEPVKAAAEESKEPAKLGRHGVDWRAAGIKAAETRMLREAKSLGLTIEQLRAQRIARDKETLIREGFADQREFYALGTSMIESGEKKWTEARKKFEALPLLADGCAAFIETIKREDRKDFELLARELVFKETGEIDLGDRIGVVKVEDSAFGSLCRRTIPGQSAEYLANCKPKLRAHNVNEWLAADRNKSLALSMRTRKQKEGRVVFGVVSPSYQRFDADLLAKIVAEEVDKKARVEIVYDGYKTRIDAHFHSPISAKEAGVGETFNVGVYLMGSDDGTGGIHGGAFAKRVRCVNMTRLEQDLQTGSQIHMGNLDRMRVRVREIVANAMKKVQTFAQSWTAADMEIILDSTLEPQKQFALLVERGYVDVRAGSTKDEVVNRLVKAWQKEPARYTKAAVLNAITRAAHENPWSSPWTSEELELTAGRLLHQRINLVPS